MPRVWQKVPNARLRVVAGPRHEYFWSTLAKPGERIDSDPRIVIEGFVEDLRPLYARADVVVVPLEVSRGNEHQSARSDGLRQGRGDHAGRLREELGLEDEANIFIREDWGQFAGAVCETLLNAPLRSRMGACARRTMEARFSWASIAERAYWSYRALAGAPQNATFAADTYAHTAS